MILNFQKIKGFLNFVQGAPTLLSSTLTDFFSAEVKIYYRPIESLQQDFNLDIEANPKRNVYILDDNKVLLVSRATIEDDIYLLAVLLTGKFLGAYRKNKIYGKVADAISIALTESYKSSYRKTVTLLNENLITRAIALFISGGHYDPYKVYNLIERFNAIRSTTFEGKYFSTGLIVTASLSRYKQEDSQNTFGPVLGLRSIKGIYEPIDTRYWYLVDGHSSFYLTDLKKEIHYMFISKDSEPDYVNKMLLRKTLQGGDVLFRTLNGRELSIITSSGIEFIYQENVWRFRDYNQLRKLVASEIEIDDRVYNAILYYVLYCSKNDTSSIIWIPKDITKVKDVVKAPHSLSRKTFNVKDPLFEQLIKRLLSSDGATVVQTDGEVKYYGCIVEMQNKGEKKVKGTGETAAGILAANGIAFKISQDGTIKLFLNDKAKVIKF